MADSNKSTKPATTKKPVVPREDPVVRLQRELEQAIVRKAEQSKKQLENARGELERATNQVERWTGLRDRAQAKVDSLLEAIEAVADKVDGAE